ncbi:MAG TPA: DUF1501 domain-containing protein [Pirellulales bacterium]
MSRRNFLRVGGFALGAVGGLSMVDLLKAEERAGVKRSHKAVINIFLAGGPPQQDMWEIKTEAPREIRGEFNPISTNVPGIQIGECFPQLAAMSHKLAFLRSVVGCAGAHDAYQCMTGWSRETNRSIGGRPAIGAIASKLHGAVDPGVPASIALAEPMGHMEWADGGSPGYLGASYAPFRPNAEGMADMTLNGVTLDRLNDRKALLAGVDRLKRSVDSTGTIKGMDSFTQAAFGVLTSNKLVNALDLSQEPEHVRKRYGDGKPYNFQFDGAPTCNEQLLMARRLVEAGARCVTLSYGRWDAHSKNFDVVRDHGPKLDQCVSALVQDLDERGMLDDTTVVVWGEFGRTPRVNENGGRDHWPQVSCALMAGGGMRTGQAIGSTNRLGEAPKDRPVDMQEIVATIYRNLGIDPTTTSLIDPTGRPQFLIDKRTPIAELV